MATLIMERPYGINWSKNLVRYVLQTDTPLDTEGLQVEMQLMYKGAGDSVFYPLFEQPAYPDADGIITFYPAAILDAKLSFQLPDLDLITPQVLTGQVGQFYLHFREISALTPNPDWVTTEVANQLKVIKGGLSYERWQGPNYFVNYYAANRTFLTWQLSGRLAALTERMYLYFLMPRAANGTVRMKVRIRYTDDTENNTLQANFPVAPGQYDIAALNVGATELNLPAIVPEKQIWWFEISVEDNGGVLALAFRYYIDYRHTYNTTQFNFINSLGGMDSVRVLGEIESTIQREFELAQITPTAGYLNDNSLAAQEFIQAVGLSRTYKGNVGFLQRKEAHYLTDLFASRQVYECRFGRWWPVLITAQEMPDPKSGEELITLPIEWKYGFTNTQFTPDFAEVGNLPTCPIITNAQHSSDFDWEYITWDGSPQHTRYVVYYQYYFHSGTGTLYTAVPSVQIPRPVKQGPGYATITAICGYGNESSSVTVALEGGF